MTETSLRPGVLFDVDGTLLDTNYLHTLAWWQAMRDCGATGVTMAAAHQAVGIASEGLIEHFLGEVGERRTTEITEAHSRRYQALQSELVAFDRAAELVGRCADAGLVVVLATSGKAEDLEWMLPAIGVEDDVVAGATTSSDVAAGKPAPDLLATALRQHGLDPARTVAIGDTVWDVQAAHAAGVTCVAFTCGGIPRCQLEAAGADEIYDGPADLLERWASSRLSGLVGS